jgi:flagellar hook-associated protein 1 FlgK
MTDFAALNSALQGLSAAQRQMDVVAQNVVNANTPGYSRQRVKLSATGATLSGALHTGSGVAFGGVNVDAVTRTRDAFLEAARAAAGSRLSALQSRASALQGAEDLLSEPGDNGLQTTIDDFFASWHDLASRPTDPASGAVVIQRGIAVSDQLRFIGQGVADRWSSSRGSLRDVVAQANRAASDLAELNGQIRQNTAAGNPANELLDQRDQLVRELGELVGAVALPTQDGMVNVSVGGVQLVAATSAMQFDLTGAVDISGATTDPPTIEWNGTAIPVDSGKAAGLLAALRTDLPGVSAQLDGVATSLRDLINGAHTAGFTLAGAPGTDFFTGTDAVSLAVTVSTPDQLAVAAAPGVVDGSNAMRIGDFADDRNATAALGGQGPSERWRDLSTEMGVTVQSLERAISVQDAVVSTTDSAVEADAGVNLDEEMTNMLLYQRAYQASARVITTMDEMLDTLVNRTGLVGR